MKNYLVYLTLSLFITNFISSGIGMASDREDELSTGHSSTKHSHDRVDEQKQIKRLKTTGGGSSSTIFCDEVDEEELEDELLASNQVYANPIFDAAAKYLLASDEIRLEFIKLFSKESDIVSTELLDNSLNPLRKLTQARNFLKDKKHIDLIKKIKQQNDLGHIRVQTLGNRNVWENIENGGAFLSDLSKVFDDLKDSFPPLERHSQLDVVCRLTNGSYALVEVQVAPQNYWDNRALSYAAAFYGNQLKRGGDWEKLEKVIAINLLGGERKHWTNAPNEIVRHYKFISEVGEQRHEIDTLQLIQYNLLSAEISSVEDIGFREWLEFWTKADEMTEQDVSHLTTKSVKDAYERVKVKDFPESVLKDYAKQQDEYARYSQHVRQEVEEAQQKALEEGIKRGKKAEKVETVLKLLEIGLSDDKIIQATQIKPKKLEKLKRKSLEGKI